MTTVKTCFSFPELVEELRDAKQQGSRLLSTAPDPQLGQAIGFKLSNDTTFRLTLAKVQQFEAEQGDHPQLVPLLGLLATTEGRIKLFMTC